MEPVTRKATGLEKRARAAGNRQAAALHVPVYSGNWMRDRMMSRSVAFCRVLSRSVAFWRFCHTISGVCAGPADDGGWRSCGRRIWTAQHAVPFFQAITHFGVRVKARHRPALRHSGGGMAPG